MSSNIEKMMEDYSLEAVPAEMRRPWMEIASIQVGIVSSLAVLMTGGIVTFMAGFWMGMFASLIAFTVSTFFTYMMGKISCREGYSSNIISRAYAFGTRGSALGSLIWAYMIIGFLGMESVLIGNSLLFYFNLESTVLKNVVLYGMLAIIWIVLSLFGMKVVARVAQIMTPLLFIMLLYMVILLMQKGSLVDVFTHTIMIPGMTLTKGFSIALNATVTLAGLIAIVATDFTRFARSEKDVLKISLVSNIAMYGVTMVFGAIITYFGFDTTLKYFVGKGLDPVAAGSAAITSPGIALVLTGGILGLLTIVFSQSKVQVGNSYEGALALVNIFDAGIKWKQGRATMVVLANILALVFIFSNILHYIESFLAIGSMLLGIWVTILLTDYYMVRGFMRKGSRGITDLRDIPDFNWIGIVTLIVNAILGYILYKFDLFPVPFFICIICSCLMYVGISYFSKSTTVVIREMSE